MYSSGVVPGSVTMYFWKYTTCWRLLDFMPSKMASRDGMVLKNQMCATGDTRLMWPMRSRRTRECVTSTPHFSQTMPLYFTPEYLPQKHSQSLVGPKIFSQNRPSRSAL